MPGKTKSTIMIDTDLWKRLKVISVLNEFEISELVEEALREKLARMQQPEQYAEYKDVESLRYKPRTTQSQTQHREGENPPSTIRDLHARADEELLEIVNVIDRYKHNGEAVVYIPTTLEFPATKNKVFEAARKMKRNLDPVIEAIKKMPDRTYKDDRDFMNDFEKVYGDMYDMAMKKCMEKLGPVSSRKRLQDQLKQLDVDSTIKMSLSH